MTSALSKGRTVYGYFNTADDGLQEPNKPLCNSHRKLALWLLKRHDDTRHDDDVGVSPVAPLSI